MTRQHYEALAQVIAESQHLPTDGSDWVHLFSGLCAVLQNDNPLFNRSLFMQRIEELGGYVPDLEPVQ